MWLLREHHGPLTADFYRYYGDSPRRLGARGVPLSDIAAMAVNLPADSATALAVHPDLSWGLSEQLLALIADHLAIANWQRGQGTRSQRPKPIRRPGVEPEEKVLGGKGALPRSDMDAWLGWTPPPT